MQKMKHKSPTFCVPQKMGHPEIKNRKQFKSKPKRPATRHPEIKNPRQFKTAPKGPATRERTRRKSSQAEYEAT